MENIWWQNIPRASRMLHLLADTILAGQNVVLYVPQAIPWRDTVCDLAGEMLRVKDPESRLEVIDCPGQDVGQYLLERYCRKERRTAYRYGVSYAAFLGESTDIVLNTYNLWVKNVSEQKLEEWLRFIVEYRKHVPAQLRPAGFILETDEGTTHARAVRGVKQMRFSDQIDAYDPFMFCALAGSELDVDSCFQPYLAQLTSACCGDDMELCAACLRRAEEFMNSPYAVMESIAAQETRSDGAAFRLSADAEKIREKIWESQIRVLFPLIEQYRSAFTRKYEDQIRQALPVTGSMGDEIHDPEDVELGLLTVMAATRKIQMTQEEKTVLDRYRKARNLLAHLRTLDVEMVKDILRQGKEGTFG